MLWCAAVPVSAGNGCLKPPLPQPSVQPEDRSFSPGQPWFSSQHSLSRRRGWVFMSLISSQLNAPCTDDPLLFQGCWCAVWQLRLRWKNPHQPVLWGIFSHRDAVEETFLFHVQEADYTPEDQFILTEKHHCLLKSWQMMTSEISKDFKQKP